MSRERSPRVAIVIQRYPPYIAGAEVQARLLARELAARLGRCDVVTSRYDAALPRRSHEEAVVTRRLRTSRVGLLRKPANFVAAFTHLLTTRHRYDVVHAFCLSPFSLGAVLAARCRGSRTVIRPCTTGPTGEVASARQWHPGGWLWRMFRLADVFIVQTPSMVSELVAGGVPSHRIVCVPNMLRTGLDAAPDAEARRNARTRIGLPDRPTVLFVGRLVAGKGLDVLCDAWRRVVTGCDASLVVVGGGPESGGLERWIHRHDLSGSVFLTGERPDPQSYYRAADIFAFPSREEGFGNVLAEAMAHGLAIVSRPVGLAQHFIEDDRNGMIVREPSPDGFAAAIDALLRDDARRERLGREARRTALMNFAPAVVTSSCLGLYERLERA